MLEEDRQEVTKVVSELSQAIKSIQVTVGSNGGKVFVHFPLTLKDFDKIKDKGIGIDADGLAIPSFTFQDKPKSVDIYLSPKLSGHKRARVPRHEFCHAVGL